MDNKKAIVSPKGLRKSFEDLCKNNSWDDPTEEFFQDYVNFVSHFDWEIIGTGPETEIGLQSVRARLKINDDTASDSHDEE